MDNAKIYRSPQLARIAASIGILIVHTPPYQPEGRGKIERFFRSVREQFLASLEVRFDPLDLTQLEIYSEGKPEGVARLVDAVVNGMLPCWKTERK
jgi:transposase InsO family protein